MALGKKWHKDCCLRCEICDKILREDNYYTENNKAYCRLDWIKNFAPKCYDCKRPIGEVLKGTAIYALGRQYHPVCFVCLVSISYLGATKYWWYWREIADAVHFFTRTVIKYWTAKHITPWKESPFVKSTIITGHALTVWSQDLSGFANMRKF